MSEVSPAALRAAKKIGRAADVVQAIYVKNGSLHLTLVGWVMRVQRLRNVDRWYCQDDRNGTFRRIGEMLVKLGYLAIVQGCSDGQVKQVLVRVK